MCLDTKIPTLPEYKQLGRHNWQNWKDSITSIIRVWKLHKHLDGSSLRPADASLGAIAAKQEKWDDADELVKAIIIMNVLDFAGEGVENTGKTAAEIWAQLVARRERRSVVAAMNAERSLEACKWQEGTDLGDHFAELRRLLRAARDRGSTFSDARFALIVCRSMPDSMRPLTLHLLGNPDPDSVIDYILDVYTNDRLQSGKPLDPLGCGTPPATSASVTTAGPENICEWCWWKNHTKGDCFCEGGGKAGMQPATWKVQPQPKKGHLRTALRICVFTWSRMRDTLPRPTWRPSVV